MLQWEFFRPRNLALIAAIVLIWMFLLSKAKASLDSGSPAA